MKRVPKIRARNRRNGFTVIELMVSATVLILISLAVAVDVRKIKQDEELSGSARLLFSGLKDLQAQALSGSSVRTCQSTGDTITCEVSGAACDGGLCNASSTPFALGTTLASGTSFFTRFGEVDATFEDRREDGGGRENIGLQKLITGNAGENAVIIQSLTASAVSTTPVTVTFNRQRGRMRINACDTPPGAPICQGSEPTTLDIVLKHTKSGDTRTIRLNAITGKISLE